MNIADTEKLLETEDDPILMLEASDKCGSIAVDLWHQSRRAGELAHALSEKALVILSNLGQLKDTPQ